MERKLEKDLSFWKNDVDRKPLILFGPRQVGKTYLVKKFAARHYVHVIYINFMEDNEIKNLLKSETSPLNIINISTVFYKIKDLSNTIFIFDEIQEVPNIRDSLKMFQESYSEVAVIALGSYLSSIAMDSRFPVGKVDIMYMKPMDFEEFLWASDQKILCEKIKESVKEMKPLDNVFHKMTLNYFYDYLIIGGMPDALKSYLNSNNLIKCTQIKENIIFGYSMDINKFMNSNTDKVKAIYIYNSIKGCLIKENKKFQFVNIGKNARYRDYKDTIKTLMQSYIIIKVNYVKKPISQLNIHVEDSSFKLYFSDVGMLSTKCAVSKEMLENESYGNVKGGLIENFFVQELTNNIKDIYYHSFTKNGNKYEIDFIIENNLGYVIPIEIKSGTKYTFKSLKRIMEDNPGIKYGIIFSAKNFSLNEDKRIYTIPIYMSGFLEIDPVVKRIKSFI